MSFDNCYFTNNSALQDKSIKRSSQYDELPYYNGDGSAFQIGHLCSSNNIKVKFYRCHFNQNKAQRHGGAISLQTLNNVEIDDCNFVENIANYNFQEAESNLLFDDHFIKKLMEEVEQFTLIHLIFMNANVKIHTCQKLK